MYLLESPASCSCHMVALKCVAQAFKNMSESFAVKFSVLRDADNNALFSRPSRHSV